VELLILNEHGVVNRIRLVVLLLVGIEAALILAFVEPAGSGLKGGDGPGYHLLATNLIDHGRFSIDPGPPYDPYIFRTPGYPAFLVLVYTVAGRSITAVRVAQFLLLALTAMRVGSLAAKFVSPRAAFLASVLCATYPPLVFQATYHLTETLASYLSVCFVDVCLAAAVAPRHRTGMAIAGGVIGGLGALVRPSFVLLPGLVLMAFLICARSNPLRDRVRTALYVGVGVLTVLVPWAARNYVISGRLIPLATGSGISLYVSAQQYTGEISYQVVPVEWAQIIGDDLSRRARTQQQIESKRPPGEIAAGVELEIEVDAEYKHDGMAKLTKVSPARICRSIPERLAYLWSTADTSPWAVGLPHRVIQVWHVLFVALVGLGLFRSRRSLAAHWPLWSVPLYLTLVHVIFHIEPRYSLPGRPFLMVYCAIAVTRSGPAGRPDKGAAGGG
jgi:4-amino-4-deoxy-L-arabinose transferase-like glycosyltransferase